MKRTLTVLFLTVFMTVSPIGELMAQRSSTIGSTQVYQDGIAYRTRSTRLTDDKILVVYGTGSARSSSKYAKVGIVDDVSKTISWGDALDLEINGDLGHVCAINPNKAALVYEYDQNTPNDIIQSMVLTIDGTNITKGTADNVNSADGGAYLEWKVAAVSNNTVVATFVESNVPKVVAGIVNGSNISWGSSETFNGGVSTGSVQLERVSENKFIIVYEDDSGVDLGQAVVGTVSGSTITLGNEVDFYKVDSQNAVWDPTVAVLSETKVLVSFSEDHNSDRGLCTLGTISGTTVSFGSVVEFEGSSSTSRTTGSRYLYSTTLSANEVMVAYESTSSSNPTRYVLIDISGSTVTPGTPVDIISERGREKIPVALTSDIAVVTYIDAQNVNGITDERGEAKVITITSGSNPEVNVQGNGNDIALGDHTPSSTDHTDFGTGGSLSRTFTVQNLGAGTLTLGSDAVSISGADAGSFSVSIQPATTVAGGESTTFTVDFTSVSATTHSAEVHINTDDIHEQDYYFAVSAVGGADPLSVSITSSTNVSCNGLSDGSITATVTGGTANYNYSWSNGSTTTNTTSLTNTITNLAAGSYTVTVTDDNGGSEQASITITEPTTLMASVAIDSNVSCNGLSDGGMTASATGGTTPYSYSWDNSAVTAQISNLIAGTYEVTVTDANNCTSTNSGTVTQPAALVVSVIIDNNVSCNGLSDGGMTASVTGGATPYSYSWDNNAETAQISSLAAGTYEVTVTDANNCTSTNSGTVTQPAALVASVVIDANVSCNGLSDGGMTASATGGATPYSFSWDNSAETAQINSLTAGTYEVTVTDANNCTSINSGTVTQPTALVASVVVDANVSCNGLSDGEITASGSGGTTPYSYQWSTGPITANLTGLIAGEYTVAVIDANGCIAADLGEVTEPTALSVTAMVDSHASGASAEDGEASSSVNGGTPPYSYEWSNLETTASVTNLAPGVHSVTVTDGNNCSATSDNIEIGISTQIEQPTASVKIYPNPTKNTLYIELGTLCERVDVSLRSLTGELITRHTYKSVDKVVFDIEEPRGIYFIEISSKEVKKVVKVIKE